MSEQLYSIQEETLTGIADALRNYYGETKTVVAETQAPIVKVLNSTGSTSLYDLVEANLVLGSIYPVKIDNAVTIKVRFTHYFDPTSSYAPGLQFAAGYYENSDDFPKDETPEYRKVSSEIIELTFEGDSVTMRITSASFSTGAYYAEITGYDADGNQVTGPMEGEVEVTNTYKPGEMGAAVDGILDNLGIGPVTLSGDCSYSCGGSMASQYIKAFGNTISTSDITNANCMFQYYKNETIPFELNMKSTSYHSMNSCFQYCNNLTQLPVFNGAYPGDLSNFFRDCNRLRYIPEGYMDSWNFERLNSYSYASMNSMFNNCYSLRKIPSSVLSKLHSPTTTSGFYKFYSSTFNCCYALDELIGLPVDEAAITSNMFSNTFSNCSRLKNIIFETNEDGSAKVASWKSQTIDLTGISASSIHQLIKYNSGIAKWKEVYDEASYQKLKDDPDWFSRYTSYSRYNHDSAVATINSLPDTSAYLATAGGTNTIKFKGAAGEKTDGGAINTLTEEEIAVATAKGWTVTLV